MSDETKIRKISDKDIVTISAFGRRTLLGLVGTGAASAALFMTGTEAKAADIDNGAWTDRGSCPRGSGGVWTGVTDSDSGAMTDSAGYGRGAPYC